MRVPGQLLTEPDEAALVRAVARLLHDAARRAHRDRRWFLGGERVRGLPALPEDCAWYDGHPLPVDLRRSVVGTRVLYGVESPAVSGMIRVAWGLEAGLPRPILLVHFAPRGRPSGSFTLRVRLYNERRTVGAFTRRRIRGRSQGEREKLYRAYLAWRRRGERNLVIEGKAWKEWRIDPRVAGAKDQQDHRGCTEFVTLLYLWQQGVVELDPEQTPETWMLAKKFLHARDDTRCFEVLAELKERYAAPQSWRQLRVYIGKTITGIRRSEGGALTTVTDDELDTLSIPSRRASGRRHSAAEVDY